MRKPDRSVAAIEAIDDRFADNLYAARRRLKVSRTVLSERVGIPVYTIEKIETGHGSGRPGLRRRVTIGEAVKLAEALGMKPGELLRGAP